MRILYNNKFVKNAFTRKIFHLYKKDLRGRAIRLYHYYKPKKYGLNLVGYYSHVFGVAEVGRFFAQLIKKSNIPFSIYDIAVPSHKKLDKGHLKEYQGYFTTKINFRKTIFFINADALPFFTISHPSLFSGRHNAAVFFLGI